MNRPARALCSAAVTGAVVAFASVACWVLALPLAVCAGWQAWLETGPMPVGELHGREVSVRAEPVSVRMVMTLRAAIVIGLVVFAVGALGPALVLPLAIYSGWLGWEDEEWWLGIGP